MAEFRIIDRISQTLSKDFYHYSPSCCTKVDHFKSKDKIVDSNGNGIDQTTYQGNTYRIISKEMHIFKLSERFRRIILAIVAIVFSLFLAIISKTVRQLLTKDFYSIKYGIPHPISPSSLDSCQVGYPMNDLPIELVQIILDNIGVVAQHDFRRVSKEWKAILETPPFSIKSTRSPKLQIFGKKAWETRFGYKIEGEIPSPPYNILEITNSLCEKLKVNSCSLLLIPKGFTVSELIARLENRFEPFTFKSTIWWKKINQFTEEEPVNHSYWVLVTNEIIKGSEYKFSKEQKAIIIDKAGSEYGVANLLEVAICAYMNYLKYDKNLFMKHIQTPFKDLNVFFYNEKSYKGGVKKIKTTFNIDSHEFSADHAGGVLASRKFS